MSAAPKKPTDAAGAESALAPLEAVAARVTDGGCLPEAWTMRLLPRSGPVLAATLGAVVLATGNLAVATVLGRPWLGMLAAYLFMGAAWMAVVAPVQEAVDDLTGEGSPDLATQARRLGWTYLGSIPLAVLQIAGLGLATVGVREVLLALAPHSGLAPLAPGPVLLWFHLASLLTLVRRRLRPQEAWLYSLLAGHGQVLRFFPLGILDVALDWRRRSQLQLGRYPGVPGQGTVHSRVGIAWAVDVGVAVLGVLVASGLVGLSEAFGHARAGDLIAVALGSGTFALGAFVAGMNLAHAYAGYLSYADGHLDAWLEAGPTRPELPAEGPGVAGSR